MPITIRMLEEQLATKDAEIARLRDRVDTRLNNWLCEMKPGYDDSITGFNEAWDIVRKTFEEFFNARAALAGKEGEGK